jgi:hypothetical protein
MILLGRIRHAQDAAEQRVKIFYYFLIIVGVLANANIQAYIYIYIAKGILFPNLLIGLVGSIISLIFILLDSRNRQLVAIGERCLKHLEQNIVFSGCELGILLQKEKEDYFFGKPLISHRWLIFFAESVVLLFFLISFLKMLY